MEVNTHTFREQDTTVFETEHCYVFVPRQPHTHASFGGHLVIALKRKKMDDGEHNVTHLFQLTAEERAEVMALQATCNELMIYYLGADIVNIQQNGNWYFRINRWNSLPGSAFHVHVYGRSHEEKDYRFVYARQKFGQALEFPDPDYPDIENSWLRFVEPYTDTQINEIGHGLTKLYEKYRP